MTAHPLTKPEVERDGVKLDIERKVADASQMVAQSWPLKTFAYRNPLRGLEHLPFDAAVQQATQDLGGQGYLASDEYRQLYRDGAITDAAIDDAVSSIDLGEVPTSIVVGKKEIRAEHVLRLQLLHGFESLEPERLDWTLRAGNAIGAYRHDLPIETRNQLKETPRELWQTVVAKLASSDHVDVTKSNLAEVRLPAGRTLSDWLDQLLARFLARSADTTIVQTINDQMIKWSAAFLDEGMAIWAMPGRDQGFFQAWRELARHDRSMRFLDIKNAATSIANLPTSAQDSIASCLKRMGVPEDRWTQYLSRLLTHLPGWTGFIRWRGENLDYGAQQKHPIDPVQYLAVRLFYEAELVAAVCNRHWGIDGTLPEIVSYWQSRPEEYQSLVGDDDATVDDETIVICRDGWRLFQLVPFLGIDASDIESLTAAELQTLISWLDLLPAQRQGAVWLSAMEASYRDRVVAKLRSNREAAKDSQSSLRAQIVFCIDVRSEPMRRQIEAAGPYQTFGFAGFFGIPISYQAFDTHEHAALCPVILSPQFAVHETPRPNQNEPLQVYAASSRWQQLGEHLFHDLKQNPLTSLILIDVVGGFFSTMLVGKTFFRHRYQSLSSRVADWFSHDVATRVPVDLTTDLTTDLQNAERNPENSDEEKIPQGFTVQQQAAFVEGALRAIGLTRDFARFVVLCGHGSTSDNNPYAAAYNCGACGGGHGDANARVFAEMANNPEVRRLVGENGLSIPDDVWFLPAKHNTVTDTISFYDQEAVPGSHADDLQRLIDDLDQASDLQTAARIHQLPQAPEDLSPAEAREHMMARSVDWANVRPEWGLSGNAAFVLGRRSLTDHVDLEGRVFLQSYDPDGDDSGAILEALMTAPLVVAQWISMEYYFSAVDPQRYGSGSKVTHNVVAGVGVMHGAHGDLETGLPLQSVNDASAHYHHPVRLLAIIQAPTERIEAAVAKHELLQHLLHNQWIHLVAVDPVSGDFRRYDPSATWERLS